MYTTYKYVYNLNIIIPLHTSPDYKVHGANKGSTWVLSALGRPHIGPMNLAIWDFLKQNDIKASALSGPVIWENIDGLPRIRIDKIGITVMEYNSENI